MTSFFTTATVLETEFPLPFAADFLLETADMLIAMSMRERV